MTADVELLPLPEMEPFATHGSLKEWATAYARSCVARATAAQAAEIERLKVVAHGFVDEIAARETKIEALREQLDWTVKQNDMLLDEGRKLTARAERLAEALRYAVDNPEFDSETFDKMARAALEQEEGK